MQRPDEIDNLDELNEAIANARATLKAKMPAAQREAVEDWLEELVNRRQTVRNLANTERRRAMR